MALKLIASLVAVVVVLSFASGLSWLTKLRIVISLFVGITVVGLLAWHVAGSSPTSRVSLVPDFSGAMIVLGMAVLAGFIAYFLTWPYGLQIGILAVPAGLVVWALRAKSIGEVMRETVSVEERLAIFSPLRWTAFFWLGVVAAGFVGTAFGQLAAGRKGGLEGMLGDCRPVRRLFPTAVTALIGSAVISLFCLTIFAQDIRMPDPRLGSVIAQPVTGQIAFAVFASFGIASFVVKKFLEAGYVWAVLSTAILPLFCLSYYARPQTVQYLSQHWPAIFYAHAAVGIVPIYMVAFGTIGAVTGYWIACAYRAWRAQQRQNAQK